jgi:monofunctional biosynthetic peptidoglycan transglycosylase
MVLRLLALAVLSPILYVLSAVAWFPTVAWHAIVPPRASAVMGYRVAEAASEGVDLRPRHEWASIESMPKALLQAVLVAEDTRFYEHRGFDLEQIRKAWRSNQSGGKLRGASTISQQTAKNLYLDPSRNVLRKGREAILTAWLELWLSKDRIMEAYLNVVELGPGIFGAGAAAGAYFDRAPEGLTRDQSALLAATLPAPLIRNPGASTPYLRRRQRMILGRMDRWYEGPSLAEEDAAKPVEGAPAAPEVLPSEPLDVEVLEEQPGPEVGGIDSVPLDAAAPTGEDPVPSAEPAAPDSVTPMP